MMFVWLNICGVSEETIRDTKTLYVDIVVELVALGIRVDAVLLIRADVYHFNESCAESKSFGACDVEILHFYVDAHPLIPHSFES